MSRIRQFHDPNLSLWQSAVDEVVAKETFAAGAQAVGGEAAIGERPDTLDPMVQEATHFCVAVSKAQTVPDVALPINGGASVEGIGDAAVFCSSLALKIGKGLVTRILGRNNAEVKRFKDELTAKFGDCDPRYAEAAIRYAEFVAGGGKIPYLRHQQLSDFVMDDLPEKATIGLVADWGTGQDEAKSVLQQVKNRNPQIVFHLGDIYYSGTQFEVDNYFFKPWNDILKLDDGNIRTFTLSGNHDMYSGGAAYYDLLKKLKQPASYFCLRNKDWQIISIDTGKNSNDGGPTHLEDTEMEWLIDKIQNFTGRTILLSHHQLFSADDDFQGQAVNLALFQPLTAVLPQVDLWLWGHEHNLVIFDEFMGLKRGRCVGCSAFPVGDDELPPRHKHQDVPVKDIQLAKGDAFYHHGYVMIQLDGPAAEVSYYQEDKPDNPLFVDKIQAEAMARGAGGDSNLPTR